MDPCSWLLVPWEVSSRDVASGPYSVDKVPISVAWSAVWPVTLVWI